jgi:hypothetical protein
VGSPVGTNRHCPACGHSFVVILAAEHLEGEAGQPQGIQEGAQPARWGSRDTREDDFDDAAHQRFVRPGTSVWLWLVVGLVGCGLLLLVVSAGGLLFWFALARAPALPPGPLPPQPVAQPVAQAGPAPRASFFVANPSCLSLSADGTRLAVGSYDKTVRVFNFRTQEELAVLAGHDKSICSVSLSPDGKSLASAGKDRLVHLWDVARKERLHTIKAKHERPLVRFLPDGNTLALVSRHDGVELFDVKTKKARDHFKCAWQVEAMDVTPDGRYLAVGGNDVRVWDLKTRQERVLMADHRGQIDGVALSQDGSVLVTGSADATVKVWDVAAGKERRTIRAPRAIVSVAITPDARLLASDGLQDGKTRFWNARTGEQAGTLETWGPLLFTPDGKGLLKGSDGQWVHAYGLRDLGLR